MDEIVAEIAGWRQQIEMLGEVEILLWMKCYED
jgi:hypothetical protein